MTDWCLNWLITALTLWVLNEIVLSWMAVSVGGAL